MGRMYWFDAEKALEVLLYIAARDPNTYAALKILYFADRDHLSRYGRLICGDSYVAMAHGPVPSGVYDIVKQARGDAIWRLPIDVEAALSVRGKYTLVPKREANLDLLSESDRECLDAAIEKYAGLSFDKLKELGHDDSAFRQADRDAFIPLKTIVDTLPDADVLWEHICAG